MAFSDLQISLVGVGAVAVAGVWAYNKWQERQHRQAAERVFRGSQADVLFDGEVPLADLPPTQPDDRDDRPQRLEPVLGAVAEVAAEPPAAAEPAPPPLPPETLVDDLVDCVARLETADAAAGYAIWEAQRPLAERLGKPLRWAGLDGEGQWHEIGSHDAGRYHRVCAAVQMADRQGALGEDEFAVFSEGIGDLADRLAAVAELPTRQEVLAHARALDSFCAGVDIQIALHVVHREGQALMGSKLRGLTSAAGLRWREDGVFCRAENGGEPLFTLANLGSRPFASGDAEALTTHGVTFWLDVPRVSAGAAVFAQMLGVARQLVAGLDGALVDDQRNPLSDAALAGIRDKIAEIQRRMADQGIPPGGLRALRLFS
jgi:hypothetical protein